MKNFGKWFGIIAFLAVIGFLMAGCDDLFGNDYELLNGAWDRGDIVVTFSDSSATFTEIRSDSAWKRVQNNGSINIGSQKFRNITKSGDKKWTCQELTYDTTTYIVKSWDDCTLTLDASGQTLRAYTPTTTNPNTTYTKR